MDNTEIIKKQLLALSKKICGEDRLEAAVQLKVHPETINRYLRGDVKKEAFGLNLLAFFKNRITKREKALVNL